MCFRICDKTREEYFYFVVQSSLLISSLQFNIFCLFCRERNILKNLFHFNNPIFLKVCMHLIINGYSQSLCWQDFGFIFSLRAKHLSMVRLVWYTSKFYFPINFSLCLFVKTSISKRNTHSELMEYNYV